MTQKLAEILTAHHEAGHAVADHRFGFYPTHVTILPDGKGTEGAAGCLDGGSLDAPREDQIICLLAGQAAQLEFARRTLDSGDSLPVGALRGAGGDLERACDLLLQGERIRDWMRKARSFVKKEWAAIEAVAHELVIQKTLDDAEVEAVISSADGDASAMDDLRRYRLLRDYVNSGMSK